MGKPPWAATGEVLLIAIALHVAVFGRSRDRIYDAVIDRYPLSHRKILLVVVSFWASFGIAGGVIRLDNRCEPTLPIRCGV